MDIILLVLHVFLSLGIITLVLLQKGAGASAGAAFGGGGGGAGSVFGASGSANFLSKTTAIFAVGFFVNSLVLAYLAANREVQTESVIDALIEQPVVEEVIEVPGAADVPAPEGLVLPGAEAPGAVAPDEVEGDVPPPAGE
ncbi:MAG: preprotein translocase subunit SecG [Gammaproteobacteria bacterium]|nr:MAG: preprotein translocase subunit SecG [Gammaproteobacteria bacterium]